MAVQSRADRGAADGQFLDFTDGGADVLNAQFALARVAAEFLAEPNGRGVHEMRAADFNDVPKFLRLRIERAAQCVERGDERGAELLGDGDVNRGGDDVVRRLAHVHVVVRVHGIARADRLARELRAAVRDHLVGVHIRRGAAAGLEEVDREMRIERALHDFIRGLFDESCTLGADA